MSHSFPMLIMYLCVAIKQRFPEFFFTNVQINKNVRARLHTDERDVGLQIFTSLGPHKGGDLFVYGKKHRFVRGTRRFFCFPGICPHYTLPFQGTRYSLVYFIHGGVGQIDSNERLALVKLGFRPPPPGWLPPARKANCLPTNVGRKCAMDASAACLAKAGKGDLLD